MPVTVVANQKGGVGKTTLSFNLIKTLSDMGKRVLGIDNDPQGNLTYSILEDPEELQSNIYSVYKQDDARLEAQKISDTLFFSGANIGLSVTEDHGHEIIFRLKESLVDIRHEFDHVIIDNLPSFGYLSSAALNAADYVLVPVAPEPYALMGIKDLFDSIGKIRKRLNPELKILGIVLNRMDGRNIRIESDMKEVIEDTYGDLVFNTVLNTGIKYKESPTVHQSIVEYDKNGKQAFQFESFIKEFLGRCNDGR